MDDLYAINFGKTEFREAFIIYMPDGIPAENGSAAADVIREQFRELTANYYVQLVPIIIEIRIQDSVAWDYGWLIWSSQFTFVTYKTRVSARRLKSGKRIGKCK